MSTILKKERQGAIMVWTLDQPETRNALTGNNAAGEFVQACEEVARDTSIRVVVLTGAGKGFCAGMDIGEVRPGNSEEINAAHERLFTVGARLTTRWCRGREAPVLQSSCRPVRRSLTERGHLLDS